MKMTKAFVILGIAALILTLPAPPVGAWNPPPGDSHYMGPAINGVFTFKPGSSGGLIFDFQGQCAGQTIAVSDVDYLETDVEYALVTEENLQGNLITSYSWLGECLPNLKDKSPDGFVFLTVKNFQESSDPDQKTADVILLWVVPQGK